MGVVVSHLQQKFYIWFVMSLHRLSHHHSCNIKGRESRLERENWEGEGNKRKMSEHLHCCIHTKHVRDRNWRFYCPIIDLKDEYYANDSIKNRPKKRLSPRPYKKQYKVESEDDYHKLFPENDSKGKSHKPREKARASCNMRHKGPIKSRSSHKKLFKC